MSLEQPKVLGTTNINYVVRSVQNRLKDYSERNYSYLEQIIIECFIDLNIWHLSNVEVVYLRMSEAKAVDLPPDFIDYTKIGIPINGKLRVLTKKKNILLPRAFEDGEEVGNTDGNTSTLDWIYFAPHFRNGQFVGGLYGLPGGVDTAYYRVDKEERRIVFYGEVSQSEIVLEYISTGVKTNGATVIPREAVPALRTYAIWQNAESDKKATNQTRERLKMQHEEEIEALRAFQMKFTKEEYKRHVYKHSRQTAKR